jgi:hypothetical protein
MRVHGIDYGAFLKAQAAPVSATAAPQIDEQKELPEPASVAPAAESAPDAADTRALTPGKTDAEKKRPKNEGSAVEKKPKEKVAPAPKGMSQKRNK